MSGISKRVSGSWVSGDYGIMKTATDTIATLPADLYPNDTTATVGISGNMEQNGTPTPDAPIMPQGTGERTGNLWTITPNANIGYNKGVDSDVLDTPGALRVSASDNGMILTADSSWANTAWKIQVIVGMTYYISFGAASSNIRATIYTADGNNKVTRRIANYSSYFPNNKELTILSNERYIVIDISVNDIATVEVTKPMITTDIIPYEPYGYKLDISSGGTTTPVYLGEVESTRLIKEFALTGEESWNIHNSTYYITVSDYYRMYDIGSHLSVCSHYPDIQVMTLPEMHYCLGGLVDGSTHTAWNGNIVFNPSPMISSLTDWKAYLAQQYAAGTPVTVWYVQNTPTTSIVNEPIRKIGTYADTVSGITIPTTTGANSFDVLTTLKPSEVTANYHGWHTGAVHERENGAWT